MTFVPRQLTSELKSAASNAASSSRRSSMDMSVGSSVNMGSPLSVAHNDLRFTASELSGGGESTPPHGRDVLLHYLPPASSRCRDGGWQRNVCRMGHDTIMRKPDAWPGIEERGIKIGGAQLWS